MSELIRYSEAQRDELEDELANKREINRRSANGITVVAYWLMREQVALIFVHDAQTNGSVEFPVPPGEVMEWFNHPFANQQCVLPVYEDEYDG